jgi:C-terminal processing protease CtpA/Prc
MPRPAEEYLAAALSLMERNALHRDHVDWHALRSACSRRAAGSSVPADTYDTIRWALTQLEDRHSFFAPPERGDAAVAAGKWEGEVSLPGGDWLPDRIACLRVPGFRGSPRHATQYADALQTQIAEMDAVNPVGWVVDLTENWGGDMWPMLAGLGPLLGEGPLGSFVFQDESPALWSYRAGRAWLRDVAFARTTGDGYRLRATAAPVALLVSDRTASSGEAVLIAFVGRLNARSFGTSTCGLTTANAGFSLPDGATVMLTVGTYADRLGRVYGHAIEPDHCVQGDVRKIQARAAAWIEATKTAAREPPSVHDRSVT